MRGGCSELLKRLPEVCREAPASPKGGCSFLAPRGASPLLQARAGAGRGGGGWRGEEDSGLRDDPWLSHSAVRPV